MDCFGAKTRRGRSMLESESSGCTKRERIHVEEGVKHGPFFTVIP